MIHSTAIVHPKAKLHHNVDIGPYAIIDEGVELGPDCAVGPHVYLTGLLKAGSRNRFFVGCVVGEAPQDLKYKNEPTGLRIGDDNTFREHVTVHRSTLVGEQTVIGSGNLLMASSHVGHNCIVGDGVILANGVLLAGHVQVGDRALISGNCLVHQFVRVGTLAMMQGGSAVSKDLPPYTIARGDNGICGLNTIGLRRAGFTPDVRLELKRLYHTLFRGSLNIRAALTASRDEFKSEPAKTFLDFVASSKRGVCADTGRRKPEPDESESQE
jgi:UDP-N-acetylglucosamine acyltransferase